MIMAILLTYSNNNIGVTYYLIKILLIKWGSVSIKSDHSIANSKPKRDVAFNRLPALVK